VASFLFSPLYRSGAFLFGSALLFRRLLGRGLLTACDGRNKAGHRKNNQNILRRFHNHISFRYLLGC